MTRNTSVSFQLYKGNPSHTDRLAPVDTDKEGFLKNPCEILQAAISAYQSLQAYIVSHGLM